MKFIDWSSEKNQWLQLHRGVSFEEILTAIESNHILEMLDHPNQEKYSGQKLMIVDINSYVYIVPYVEDSEKIFLKTIYPSRKYTKHYFE